jgi:predicted nucleic acid-binding protein
VIFLDSWVWLAYLVSGDTDEAAEAATERANTPAEGGLIAPTVLTDVSYRVRVVADEATATETVRAMREYEYIDSAPLIDEVADDAAALRDTDPTLVSANSRMWTRSISQRPSGTMGATHSLSALHRK